MSAHTEDLSLARAVLRGDKARFERFLADYLPRLYRFVLPRIGRDEPAAEDICQAALERAVRHLGSYRGEAALFTWICTIARNELADYWACVGKERAVQVFFDQDESVRAALESIEADPDGSPEVALQQRDLLHLVQTVLDHLPVQYGDALEWKYIDGLDVEEIARRLQVTLIAAQSLLARARDAFRREFAALPAVLRHDVFPTAAAATGRNPE